MAVNVRVGLRGEGREGVDVGMMMHRARVRERKGEGGRGHRWRGRGLLAGGHDGHVRGRHGPGQGAVPGEGARPGDAHQVVGMVGVLLLRRVLMEGVGLVLRQGRVVGPWARLCHRGHRARVHFISHIVPTVPLHIVEACVDRRRWTRVPDVARFRGCNGEGFEVRLGVVLRKMFEQS